MTEEQKTLQEIRGVIAALSEEDRKAVYASYGMIREAMASSKLTAGLLALALVGAELAAEE